LAAGTMTVSWLHAKTTASMAAPLSSSVTTFAMSADAKTSAGAPCSIWARNAEDASKE
jgi:hypothetical protein